MGHWHSSKLHSVTLAAFAPVFFALAGLKVRIPELFTPRLGGLALVILAVAVVTKVAGAYVGARLAGSDSWSALGFGFALDARGAVGIIIASIGLRLDVFSVEVYSIVVLVAVVTSLIAAPMVSWCLQHVPLSADEKARLSRREGEIGFRRILVPVRPRPEIAPVHRMTARIVDRLGGTPSITMLSVASKDDRQVATRFIGALSDLYDTRPSVRVVSGERPVEAILEAASADIDLLILGAPEASVEGENLFDPLIDALARMAPCPTLIVAGSGLDRVQWPPHRVLFPTNGSQSSQRAAHLACSLGSGGEVVALNVVERTRHARTGASEPSRANRLLEAEDIVADVERLGSAYGVVVTSSVRLARQDPSDVIVAAIDEDIDIVVLATDLRPGSGRLHLGPTVEAILRRAPCPVVLINGL